MKKGKEKWRKITLKKNREKGLKNASYSGIKSKNVRPYKERLVII